MSAVKQNVGEYQMQLSAGGLQKLQDANPNYSFDMSDVQSGLFQITPKAITVTAPTVEKVYDGTAYTAPLTPTVTGVPANGEKPEFKLTDVSNTINVGATVLKATASEGTANYDVTYVDGSLKITPKPLTKATNNTAGKPANATKPTDNPAQTNAVTIQGATKVYDGTSTTPDTFKVLAPTADSNFVIPVLTASDFDKGAIKSDAGTYTVKLSKTGLAALQAVNPDYSFDESNVQNGLFVITKAPIKIVAPTISKDFDQKPYTGDLNATVTGKPAASADVQYSLTDISGDTAIGTYPINVTLGVNDNYDVTVVPGQLTIKANNFSLTTNYTDANGTKLAPSTTTSAHNFGDTYTTSAKAITGYYLTSEPANAQGTFKGDVAVTYVYAPVGSDIITLPNGTQSKIAYQVDGNDMTKVTVPTGQVVPYVKGYTAVNGDTKTPLTPVNAKDVTAGYQLPGIPENPSKDTLITYVADQSTNGGSTTAGGTTSGSASGVITGNGSATSTGAASTTNTTPTSGSETNPENSTNSTANEAGESGQNENNNGNQSGLATENGGQSTGTIENTGEAGTSEEMSNQPSAASGKLLSSQQVASEGAATTSNTTPVKQQKIETGTKASLPQTDENSNASLVSEIGVVLLGMFGLFGKNKKKRQD